MPFYVLLFEEKGITKAQSENTPAPTPHLIVVTNNADSGPGSLRQAIADVADGGLLRFDPSLSGQTITLATALEITKDLTIDGSGLNPRMAVSGNDAVRIFRINNSNSVFSYSPTLKNGNRTGTGYTEWGGAIYIGDNCQVHIQDTAFDNNSAYEAGAIYVRSELTIVNSTFTLNSSQSIGGAIAAMYADLIVRGSTFADNSAVYSGGAVHTGSVGTHVFENNSFMGNIAQDAGAIRIVEGSVLNVTVRKNLFSGFTATYRDGAVYVTMSTTSVSLATENNTFYANQAETGGGIDTEGLAVLSNNTFSDNVADASGGGGDGSVYMSVANTTLYNNIMANAATGGECGTYGSYYSDGGNNLVEDGSSACLPSLTGEPLLDPPADNGGSTWTMALPAGSPATDAGDDARCPLTDQREAGRPQGLHCDIGAFGFGAIAPVYTNTSTPTITNSPQPTSTGTPTITPTPSETGTPTRTETGTSTITPTPSNTLTASPTVVCFTYSGVDTVSGGDPTAIPANSAGCAIGKYQSGESLALVASPADGWTVGGWHGTDNDSSTLITNSVTMPSSDWTVTVNRRRICPLTGPLYDLNGDCTTDIGVYRPATGAWYIRNLFSMRYGQPADRPVPGDYNGDGITDVAVYRPSTGAWYIRNQYSANCGASGDIPVPGDYNGDGTTDIAVYRPSNGAGYIRNQYSASYGAPGDIPTPDDYNGDGTTDIAVYRPSTGAWYIRGQSSARYGVSIDIPVPGDYNGDGTTDIAVYRPATGGWYIREQYSAWYGASGDIAIPGDYNGDGTTDIAVFRPSTGAWYIRNQFLNSYGSSGDIPLPELSTGKASTAP